MLLHLYLACWLFVFIHVSVPCSLVATCVLADQKQDKMQRGGLLQSDACLCAGQHSGAAEHAAHSVMGRQRLEPSTDD